MKRILLLSLAAATIFAGCNRDEIIERNPDNAISFNNAFVNSTTRLTDVTTGNLDRIYVHAMFKAENGNSSLVFNNTEVAKQASGSWTYDPKKYWFKGLYDFKAVNLKNEDSNARFKFTAGIEDAFAAGSSIMFDNSQATGYNGEQDLIYATTQRNITDPTDGRQTQVVPFTFDHLLSKVKFTLTNAMGEGYTLEVKNLKISDAVSKADIQLDNAQGNTWVAAGPAFDLAFINLTIPGATAENANKKVSNEKYIIPKTGYAISFTVDVKDNGTIIHSKAFTVSNGDMVFKLGYSYNFTTEIKNDNFGVEPIQFSVQEVNGFTENGDTPITIQ